MDKDLGAGAMCLDDDQIVLLLEGVLSERTRAEIDAHLDSCAACRRLVAASSPEPHEDEKKGESLQFDRTVAEAGARTPKMAGDLARGASIGRYLVLSLLGRGGMGKVYAAYDPELDRRVAIKLVHTGLSADGDRSRLVREARALGKLSHPNVVQVHDVGEYERDVFLAMELVDGEPLDRWCLSTPRRPWREVLSAYLDAARGLSAAHEKGLVHRDVKPSNILRGTDGRVRVVDFGLAAGFHGAKTLPSAPEATSAQAEMQHAPDERLTATGALLGTPAYMAPEQHQGSKVGPASDQYGLCVALYEGLYGALPFIAKPGTSPQEMLPELFARKASGVTELPPAGSSVPVWVHKALMQGLAVKSEDRHPSVDALIAALSQDPAARRRKRWQRAGVGVGAATLLVVAAVGRVGGSARRNPCEHPEQHLAGVWDEGVKRQIRDAFIGTGRPYAESVVTRVTSLLNRYSTEWATMRGQVCEASRSDDQHREILSLREMCLDRRRGQLQALTTLLVEKPDPEVLDNSVQSASGLYPVDYCADAEALTARVHPPEDPVLRARVADLEPKVDRLEALSTAGKYEDALALGEPLLVEVAALSYAPLRAQVQNSMGRMRVWTGDFARGKALLYDAAVSAAEGKDDVLVANAWAGLLDVVGEKQQDFAEASVIRAAGSMVMARIPDEPRALALWSNSEGNMLFREGKFAEAKLAYERSLALREKFLGPNHPETAEALLNLGAELCAMGDCLAGKAPLERAVAISETSLGPDHPTTGFALNNLGILLDRVGDYARAVAVLERALTIGQQAIGSPSASLLESLGSVFYDMGDYSRAAAIFERVLAMREAALRPDDPSVAAALIGLGRAKVRLKQLDAALPLLERARLVIEKKLGSSHPEMAAPLLAIGEFHLARGKPEEAEPLLEHALALNNEEIKNEIELTLAGALFRRGKDRARALQLAEQARAAYQSMGHRPGVDRATHWLIEHEPLAKPPVGGRRNVPDL